MSDVLHDEWDRAYEEGREVGRKEAWSGDYDYRKLMQESRERAIRDAIAVIKVQQPAIWEHPRDSAKRTGVWLDDAIAAIKALGGER